jgi:predicted MFS family arabinose efflux permease
MESISHGDVIDDESTALQRRPAPMMSRAKSWFTRALGVARDADFACLWAAQSISSIGSQFTVVALPLLAALALGASPQAVGLLTAAQGLPHLLFGLFVGAWVDRLRRRPLMIAADFGRAVALAAIPVSAAFGLLRTEIVIVVAFVVAFGTAIFDTAYSSYVPALVPRDQLVEANSRLQASESGAQVIGPALAGIAIRLAGAPGAIAIDALSYLASASFLWRIRLPEPAPRRTAEASILAEVRQGLNSVIRDPILRPLALATGILYLGAYLFYAVYVLYMTRSLGLGPEAIGLVFAAGGIGALIGSVMATPVRARWGTGATLMAALLLFGLFGLTIPLAVLLPRYALPLIVASEFLQWLTLMIYIINAMSLRQAITPHHLLGRVNGTWRFLIFAFQPVGALVGGFLGERIGLPATLVAGAAVMLVAFVPLLPSPIPSLRTLPAEIMAPV